MKNISRLPAKNDMFGEVKLAYSNISMKIFMAMATIMTGIGASTCIAGAATIANPFTKMEANVGQIIQYCISMMMSFVIPLAGLAVIIAIIVMYIPGSSMRAVEQCKGTIKFCIGSVVVIYALQGILSVAQMIGQSFF